MARRSGDGKEFDPEYKNFRDYVQGQWGDMPWGGGESKAYVEKGRVGTSIRGIDISKKGEGKKALDILMMRKGIYNAKREKKREHQQQKLLDVAWKELRTGTYKAEMKQYAPWSSLSKAEKRQYAYKDDQGRTRYNRPDYFFDAVQENVRVKDWAEKNKARINSDSSSPYGIRKQGPYKHYKTGRLITPDKYQAYDKKTGKIVRWAGA